jgi:pyruvate/2-oxoglutarate dehydrogenase complex dihydrolipoamide dehydrogenase (E3) component
VKVDATGFIETDGQRRTAESNIFAVGDVAGEPMLAHKASHEARVGVEAIAGQKAVFEPLAIPAVVFTDPEIAWTGLRLTIHAHPTLSETLMESAEVFFGQSTHVYKPKRATAQR